MPADLAIIVIGRNEGERLRACLLSTLRAIAPEHEATFLSPPPVVRGRVRVGADDQEISQSDCPASAPNQSAILIYVDSASTDSSIALAADLGAHIVQLNPAIPFTAARARNEGFQKALSLSPNIQFVQFIDGDCELSPTWLEAAQHALQQAPTLAAVRGRLRERHPEQSLYTQLLDLEWDAPPGDCPAVGGITLFRVAAFSQAGGFNPAIAAGEEPELCSLLRQSGWKFRRLDSDMATHDAAMTKFTQWWKRESRFGFATIDAPARRRGAEDFYAPHRRSARLWTLGWLLFAVTIKLTAFVISGWKAAAVAALIALCALAAQALRIATKTRQRGRPINLSLAHGAMTLLGKWPQLLGQWRAARTNPPIQKSAPLRIAYLTGEYDRPSHTFIHREVAALRELGHNIHTFSVRANPPYVPSSGTSPFGSEAQARRGGGLGRGPSAKQIPQIQKTFYLLPATFHLPFIHLTLFFTHPRLYIRAATEAIQISPRNPLGLFKQCAYFAEAGLLAHELRRRRIAHLHNHFADSSCTVALLASRLAAVPFSFTLHGPADFLAPTHWRLDHKIRRATFVACISQFAKEQALRCSLLSPPPVSRGRARVGAEDQSASILDCSELTSPASQDKLHIIHCGVDPAQFTPPPSRPSPQNLLFVGRLAPAKGLPFLLRAFSIARQTHPTLTLTLAGDGPDRPALEKLATELNLIQAISFLGFQSPPQIQTLLTQSDIFLLTSLAEGVPVVLMEAMAAGVPVISTRVGGVSELIDNTTTGLLTPAGNPQATADAILKLLADDSLRSSLATAARKKVEQEFNLTTETKKLSTLLLSPSVPSSGKSAFGSKAQARRGGGLGRGPSANEISNATPLSPPLHVLRGRAGVGVEPQITPRAQSPVPYLLISPCRNEAPYLRRSIDSVLAQTILPSQWIIVDDGSTDQTRSILTEYAARHAFIRIVPRADRGFRKLGGGVIDAFYDGFNSIDPSHFTYFAKLDLDVDLPPRYFQSLIHRMESEPRLGSCSGKPHYISPAGRLIREPCGDEQSVGMAKFYRMACFTQIGGFVRELMWDGIDGHRCRMSGWIAASWNDPELRFEHLRPMGASDKGLWTGRVRHGYGQYFMGAAPLYMLASCIYRLPHPPRLIGSIALLWGYLKSALRRLPRYGNDEFRHFLRRYQWACLIKGKSLATAELNARQARKWDPLKTITADQSSDKSA